MANQKPPNRQGIVPNFGQPQRRPMPPRPGLVPYNPKNYLRPNMRTAKIIDLNKAMSTWGANQAKLKINDLLISKKILQNLDEAKNFAEVISQEKFKKNLKTIDDVLSGPKGEISYKFKEVEGFLTEDVIFQNYVLHYNDQVWKYYLEKNKNQNQENTK